MIIIIGLDMRYKKFIFNDECIMDNLNDTMIFPFQDEYLDYQDWILNNPNDYTMLISNTQGDSKWQGLLEEVHEVRKNIYHRKLYYKDYTLWVESEVKLLPNQDYQTHGEQTTYYTSGRILSKEYFRQGVKMGEYFSYSDIDNSLPTIHGFYDTNKKVGEWEYYFANSDIVKVIEKYSVAGILTQMIEYDISGKEIKISNYKDSKLNGIFRDSHNNGELRCRGNMRKGLMDGLWSFYYRDSAPEYQIKFDNGIPIGSLKYFAMDGKLNWEKEVI
jgi:antitoxin component YwqK of YwqJK toxin-antitoxin module